VRKIFCGKKTRNLSAEESRELFPVAGISDVLLEAASAKPDNVAKLSGPDRRGARLLSGPALAALSGGVELYGGKF